MSARGPSPRRGTPTSGARGLGASSGGHGSHAGGLALVTAFTMIAYQVGARATRDALFLSSFSVTALPAMTIASALFSITMAFAASRALSRFGPERVIPMGYATSAVLLVGEWALVTAWPAGGAVAVYLHYGGLGALLISGFWSFLNERLDPRGAKRALGRIAAGGTVGGLAGGLLAERVGAALPVTTMLPILAGLNVACAAFIWRLRVLAPSITDRPLESGNRDTPLGETPTASARREVGPPASGLRVLRETPYLRTLVALVLLVTVTEGLVDWVFKARAAASMARPQDLLRLFAVFYTGASLLTVVVQAAFSRLVLERLGLVRSVAALPAAVGLGSVASFAAPGLSSALGLRATESVLSNSLYRAGYESLFTPLPARERRAAKTLVDVGAARVGDMLGAGMVQVSLPLVGMAAAPTLLLGVAAAVCIVTLEVARRLHKGYVDTLERGLVSRAVHLDMSEVGDATTRSAVLQSMGALALSQILDRSSLAALESIRPPGAGAAGAAARGDGGGAGDASSGAGGAGAAHGAAPDDPLAERAGALASGRRDEVRRALLEGPLPGALVPQAIALLAWDEVAKDAIAALRLLGSGAVDPLVAALVDPQSDFAIRRRIPLILGTVDDAPAVEGLLRGLEDRRFEVRFRSGRALSHLVAVHPKLGVPPDRVFDAVRREVLSERAVWESQRLLDRVDDELWSPVADDALRVRANRSMEHVFTLLSLALPRQPVQIAFRGIHTNDPLLRGTALEYLESSLPADIRKPLWPYLEDDRPRRAAARSTDDVLADLLRSNESIVLHLDALRKGEAGPEARPGD